MDSFIEKNHSKSFIMLVAEEGPKSRFQFSWSYHKLKRSKTGSLQFLRFYENLI